MAGTAVGVSGIQKKFRRSSQGSLGAAEGEGVAGVRVVFLIMLGIVVVVIMLGNVVLGARLVGYGVGGLVGQGVGGSVGIYVGLRDVGKGVGRTVVGI